MPLFDYDVRAALTLSGAVAKPVLVMQSKVMSTTTTGTSIETLDTHTIAAGVLAASGDAVDVEWLLDQANSNTVTITVLSPDGGGMLADARALSDDRYVRVRVRRVTSTTCRVELNYRYGDGVDYAPDSVTDTVANMDSNSITVTLRATTGVSAGDVTVVGKTVKFYPGVA